MRPDYLCGDGCGYIMIEDMELHEEENCLKCPKCGGVMWYIEKKVEKLE